MKYFAIIFFLVVSFSCSNLKTENGGNAKPSSIITKYTELKVIPSKEVNDTFYIYIRLPKHYNSEEKIYPVLYLLDGDIAFNMSTSIVRYLQYSKDVPDLIIVGIGYGTMLNDDEDNFRERDYSISNIDRFESSGGGKNFSNFLERELIPFIDSNYRTNNKRILNGYSLGGLFTINTLLTKPNLFDDYIAGSPYLKNDIDELIQKSSRLNISENTKLFISVGEKELAMDYHVPIKNISEALSDKTNIKIEYVEFENGTHFTCPSEALTYGLKYIFHANE